MTATFPMPVLTFSCSAFTYYDIDGYRSRIKHQGAEYLVMEDMHEYKGCLVVTQVTHGRYRSMEEAVQKVVEVGG